MVALDRAYAETKAALLAGIEQAGEGAWSRRVPATPEWTVRDVVAHVTGLASDAADGSVPPGLNLLEQFRDEAVVKVRDDFADGQVIARQDRTADEVVQEWTALEPRLLARMWPEAAPENRIPMAFDAILVTDLCVHADDVAGALGRPPGRGSGAAGIALPTYAFGVDYRIRVLGLPALALRYEGRERVLGEGPPAAAVTADRWELLRVLAGRRSSSQIEALAWEGDAGPYLPLLPAYGERAEPLVEPRA